MHTEAQIIEQIDGQIGKHMGEQTAWTDGRAHRGRQMSGKTDTDELQADGGTDKHMGGQMTDRQTDRQAHRGRQMMKQTDKSAGRQMD